MVVFWTYWVKSNVLLKCMPLVSLSPFQCGYQKTDTYKWGSHFISVGQCSFKHSWKATQLPKA